MLESFDLESACAEFEMQVDTDAEVPPSSNRNQIRYVFIDLQLLTAM